MSEKVREINFKYFRGLPDYTCTLKVKNLLILGGNGKGKSAIVDGIEFLFGGKIRRFHGEGSGRISHDTVICHVLRHGKPKVEISLTPSNGSISRIHGTGDLSLNISESIFQSYIDKHPPVEAFILRRNQILEFITNQEAKRYQKFIRLLGLDFIDQTQKSFVDAIQLIDARKEESKHKLELILRQFSDTETDFIPRTLEDIFSQCYSEARKLGIECTKDIQGLKNAIKELDLKRAPENRQRINILNVAISRLENIVLLEIETHISNINKIHEHLRKSKEESSESKKGSIIKEGVDYFREYPEITDCPLCEQPLKEGYKSVFERLELRNKALEELYELEKKRSNEFDLLISKLENALNQLNQEKNDHRLYKDEDSQKLIAYNEDLQRWIGQIKDTKESREYSVLVFEEFVSFISKTRLKVHKYLIEEKNEYIHLDTESLGKSYTLLKVTEEKVEAINTLELTIKKDGNLLNELEYTDKVYTKAREYAIQEIFDKISDKVITYYNRLHDISECTKIELTPTSRAAAGGLQLEIEFFNKGELIHPLAYLSDGHLDSLGICIYLASVRLFNTPGSLLVLDDIITSIDKDHRHRLTELLLEEFQDYQLMITTHDEYWFNNFKNRVQAYGYQNEWKFDTISRWTLESGPESSAYEGTWDWIDENLNEPTYRSLGGDLRLVFEDFVKRVAEKILIKVEFRQNGKYTVGDFKRVGIDNKIREKLLNENSLLEIEIRREISRVFGNAQLINNLSHDNLERLEITLQETIDFVNGLKELKKMCEAHSLIRG